MAFDRDAMAKEFDAAIGDLERALRECPGELWEASVWPVLVTDAWIWPRPGVDPIPERTEESIQAFSAFWCVAYHCLWFLDFYVTADPRGFESPDYIRGGPEELGFAADGAVALPGPTFPRESLLKYVDYGRTRIHNVLSGVTDAQLSERCGNGHPHTGKTLKQLLDVNLAHVKEHGAQLLDFVQHVSA